MSVRNFHNIFCPTCDKDTLHIALKCTECGTVVVTAAEQWRESRRDIRKSPFKRIRIARNITASSRERKKQIMERLRPNDHYQKSQTTSRTVFGSGRARKRA